MKLCIAAFAVLWTVPFAMSADEHKLLATEKNASYWEIHSVTVTELPSEEMSTSTFSGSQEVTEWPMLITRQQPRAMRNIPPFIDIIGQFMTIGEKIWKIIASGKPVLNIAETKAINVLPVGAGNAITALDLGHWSLPQVKNYKIVVKNGFKMNVVDFEYKVFYSYGGSYDGTGSYLAGVSVGSTYVKAKWGFKVDVDVGGHFSD